jgi:hypothetical protein
VQFLRVPPQKGDFVLQATLSLYETTIRTIFDNIVVIGGIRYRLERVPASDFSAMFKHHFVALEQRYRPVLE